MGYTTFTGPVRAGNILNTSGITPGVDVSNVGQVVMAQSVVVEEDTNTFTTASIPAYSQILTIEFRTTIAFTNAVSVGNSYDGTTVNDATYFSDAVATPLATGPTTIATTTLTQNDNWLNIGYPDSQIVVAGGAAGGPGRAILTITYLQGPNGNT
jgi:hypothetical protein